MQQKTNIKKILVGAVVIPLVSLAVFLILSAQTLSGRSLHGRFDQSDIALWLLPIAISVALLYFFIADFLAKRLIFTLVQKKLFILLLIAFIYQLIVLRGIVPYTFSAIRGALAGEFYGLTGAIFIISTPLLIVYFLPSMLLSGFACWKYFFATPPYEAKHPTLKFLAVASAILLIMQIIVLIDVFIGGAIAFFKG